ncbi:MAG: hypothetical protein U1U88_002352 [Lawsonella clevelandensis]
MTDGISSSPQVAQLLNVPVTRVHQLLRQQQLIAVERDGVVRGACTVLRRAGYC